MKLDKYRGIIPTFYVYYDKTGEISEDGARALTRYFVNQGVKGAHADGSSGEYIYQSMGDREKTLEAAADEAASCLAVITHATYNNARDSRILATHTQDLGMDGIAVISPVYPKLPEYPVAGYWSDISEAVPKTNFIIYNILQLVGTILTMNLLKTVLLGSRVADVKSSSIPVQDIQMFKAEVMKIRQSFTAFNGLNKQLVSGLAVGTDGGIGGIYGAIPKLFLEIYELVSENGTAEARAIRYETDEVIHKLCSGTCNMHAMIKEVLRISKGIDIGEVRKSLTDLCGNDRAVAGEATAMMEDAKERYC